MSPEHADLLLAADVPHTEREVLVLDALDVEACEGVRGWSVVGSQRLARMSVLSRLTNRGDRCDDFSQLQLVQDYAVGSERPGGRIRRFTAVLAGSRNVSSAPSEHLALTRTLARCVKPKH